MCNQYRNYRLCPAATTLAAFFFLWSAPMQGLNFVTQSISGGMATPNAIVVADFNQDNRPDMAVSNYTSNSVSVFLNRGNGSFAGSTSYRVGVGPAALATADLNNDGKLDLVTPNFNGSNDVSVLLGRGDGSFQNAQNYPASQPHYLVITDLNNDAAPDLAVVGDTANTLSLLLNRGDGTFGAATNMPSSGRPHALAAGDFNGDGNNDLAIANLSDNQLSIRLGNGNGTLRGGGSLAVGDAPHHALAVDLNRDGKLDLVVANSGSSNNLSVLLGRGDATFGPATQYATGQAPLHVEVGDFNIDGSPDLAVSNLLSNDVSVLLGAQNGTFRNAINFPAGPGTTSLAVDDIDRDGRSDVATVNAASSSITLLLTSQPVTAYEADVAPRPSGNNGAVTITDWVQVGRFAAGLDTAATGSEFQRADCAPKATLGDGRITIADWVQAGRYATGLDPIVAAGGPTSFAATSEAPNGVDREERAAWSEPATAGAQSGRAHTVFEMAAAPEQPDILIVRMRARGDENAVGFSLRYDPNRWRIVRTALSSELTGATLTINTEDAASGKVGVLMALPAGQAMKAGLAQLLTLRFARRPGAPDGSAQVRFADLPIARAVVDVNALPVSAIYKSLKHPVNFVIY